MVTRLDEEQLDHVREAFRIFDTDGDGLITASDLRLLLQSYGRNYPESELETFLNDLPVNFEADGKMDFPQFMLWMAKLAQRLQDESFKRRLDEENALLASIPSGPLNEKGAQKRDKAKQMKEFRELDQAATAEARANEARKTFDLFDRDGKGFISWEDLQRVSEETGENWPSSVLDDMMMAVVTPGQPREIRFEQWVGILNERIAWNERSKYKCQEELEASLTETQEGSSDDAQAVPAAQQQQGIFGSITKTLSSCSMQ